MKQAKITLSEYQQDWPEKFESEKQFLLSIIGNYNKGSVEHVGSTAIKGLIAKPVIDIMFGVGSLVESKPAIDILVKNGYVYSPYKGDVMHWFCKPSNEFRTHHLHLVPFESHLWNERIKFRNILRNNLGVAKSYAKLKSELAIKYKEDREAYTVQKWPFIKQVLGI